MKPVSGSVKSSLVLIIRPMKRVSGSGRNQWLLRCIFGSIIYLTTTAVPEDSTIPAGNVSRNYFNYLADGRPSPSEGPERLAEVVSHRATGTM